VIKLTTSSDLLSGPSTPYFFRPILGKLIDRQVMEEVQQTRFWNEDLAPVSFEERKWGIRDMAVLWISMSACIPTYTLASSLIDRGMNWWQAVATIFLGNLIVLVPMVLNAHAGTKYGISFPVYCRSAYGLLGANLPAMLRALVACGWFGIQTWIGGAAVYAILGAIAPGLMGGTPITGLGINALQLICFLVFWSLNMLVIYLGIDSIRYLLNIKAPLLILLGLLFLSWAYVQADGFGPMLSAKSAFESGGTQEGKFWQVFFPSLTANVGFWATLSLNIPDFSRYAKSQRDQALGQAIGLPTTMAFFAFIGVAVTSATLVIFGETIWDPVEVLKRFENRFVLIFAMLALCIATLATNIAANVVSPANDFAHLAPRWITFRIGGLITGIIGVLIQPWRLVADPTGYIFVWLIAYSALLGSVGGVLIADYFIIRRTQLSLKSLYDPAGEYWYLGGWNWYAVIATVLGIVPCVPGFYLTVTLQNQSPNLWLQIYDYAWFISFAVAACSYVVLSRYQRTRQASI
jgi:nucleobase:cation symporter-1, NCS1 family